MLFLQLKKRHACSIMTIDTDSGKRSLKAKLKCFIYFNLQADDAHLTMPYDGNYF